MESTASSLEGANPTAWMPDTVAALQSLGEPPSETSAMTLSGASAVPDSSTTAAPFSAKSYCEENLLVCVLPAVGGVLAICIIAAFLRRRKTKQRAAIETVQENMVAQHTHQQNWFRSQDEGEAMNTFGGSSNNNHNHNNAELAQAASTVTPAGGGATTLLNLDDGDSDLDLDAGGGENLDNYLQDLEFDNHDL